MPLWATLVLLGVVTSVGAGLLKYAIQIASALATLTQMVSDNARRITALEAERAAWRNGYFERPDRLVLVQIHADAGGVR
jgi:hypothetical protein